MALTPRQKEVQAKFTEWSNEKRDQVWRRIFEAAERDLSVNDGALPQDEVDECLEIIDMALAELKTPEEELLDNIDYALGLKE